MIESKSSGRTGAPHADEWRPIYDANQRLLFEVSLLTGAIRIKARELTTVVDVNREREKHLRALVLS